MCLDKIGLKAEWDVGWCSSKKVVPAPLRCAAVLAVHTLPSQADSQYMAIVLVTESVGYDHFHKRFELQT